MVWDVPLHVPLGRQAMAPRSSPEMPLALAESAFRLFAKKGIRNVNLDTVAAAVGVTKGSVYWHFHSKRELLQAACEHYYRAYHERIAAEIARGRDPIATLKHILRLNVRICLIDAENRNFTLEILTLSVHDKVIRQSWLAFYDRVRDEYVELLLAAGLGDRRAAAKIANSLLETFEGVKLRALFEPAICNDRDEEERIVQTLMVIAGLAPARAAPARARVSARRRAPAARNAA
jgi:AcrR family transcriptional regulator